MIIPEWAILGSLGAFFQGLMPLIQERYKADAFAVSSGIKLVAVLLMLPLVLIIGLPTNPGFYLGVALMAVMWCISDVQYYRAVSTVGAGVISRILPGTTILTFLAWFIADPALIQRYWDQPAISAGIAFCVLLSVYCAMHLSRCPVTRQAVGMIWFVMVGTTIGPIAYKLVLAEAGAGRGPVAYAFIEGLCMLFWWGCYAAIKKPLPLSAWLKPATIKASLCIGIVLSFVMLLGGYAMLDTEHPSYVTLIRATDVLWILLIYKIIGRREDSNVAAGLGIVAAAAGLVVLKSL